LIHKWDTVHLKLQTFGLPPASETELKGQEVDGARDKMNNFTSRLLLQLVFIISRAQHLPHQWQPLLM